MAARFYDVEAKGKLRDKRRLSAFLEHLIHSYRPQLRKQTLTYLFRTDEALLDVNQQYLHHDTYTDIITFDLSAVPEILEGEIHISTERVAENAIRFKTDYQTELHRVIFHGALHLAGLKDKTAADAKHMRAAEDAALHAYFQPTIA
jgi:rRNA maturation RNase YbeY